MFFFSFIDSHKCNTFILFVSLLGQQGEEIAPTVAKVFLCEQTLFGEDFIMWDAM